jgi:hypothetical protein
MTTSATIGRGFAVLFFCAALAAGGTAGAGSKMPKSTATFGDKLSFASAGADDIDYFVSDDKLAFTLTFKNALEATVGAIQGSTSTDPIGTKVFSAVIPASGKAIDTTFFVTAFTSAEEGASGTLLLKINDQQTVMRFRPGEGKDTLVKLRYRAKPAGDLRLTLLILAEHDAAHPKATALVHVNTIETDLAAARKKKTAKND